jgi:glucose/arabinose dehydrogenase
MLATALAVTALAAAGPPARLERVAAGFEQPVYVTGVPGRPSALAVVERYGRVRLLRPGRARRPVLVDLRSRVGIDDPRETVDQRGLLSVAFAPDYTRSGRLYLDYVDRDGRLRVDEWRRGALRPLLDLGFATTQHHGGQLQFGPDGLLYVSTGMGDDPDTSQDAASPGGKILRVDPLAPAPRPEVVALGLRNPWRFSFHRGRLLIGDVGEHRQEEVDVLAPGQAPANFGWPFREGRARLRAGAPAGLRAPEIVHRHGRGWCSLVGGYVLRGYYVYGDVCSGRLWSARFRAGALGRPHPLGLVTPYLVSFGRDTRGRVYAVSLTGRLWRFR